MAKEKATEFKFEFVSHLMDAPIFCKNCDEDTTRTECRAEYGSWGKFDTTDYYCPHCNQWIRTDTRMKPLPPKNRKK